MRALLAAILLCTACRPPCPVIVEIPQPTVPKPVPPPPLPPRDASVQHLFDLIDPPAPACLEIQTSEAEVIRQWALLAYLPCQAKKKELFAQILAKHPNLDGASVHVAAATYEIEGRMDESFASDWIHGRFYVSECDGNPTICASAETVGSNAARVWFDRAIERYELCAYVARSELPLMEAACNSRIYEIEKSPFYKKRRSHLRSRDL